MFQYQDSRRYFAQVAEGFEEGAARELADLGAQRVEPGFRGLYFRADPGTLYAVNYRSRLASRILAPLASFSCRDRGELYRAAKAVDWPALFSADDTFAIHANVSGNAELRNSLFAAQCLKDAVADRFTEKFGRRPSVDRLNPDVWLNLHIERSRATVSLDTSGGALYRRGYRREPVAAPLQENLAAAMVSLSGWDGSRPLYDPMCGSGTLLCEAAMAYGRIPAGFLRQAFGFRFLPDFDAALWERVKRRADADIRALPRHLVAGSDIDPAAVKAARANCGLLPGGGAILISCMDYNAIPALEDRVILCNPPYGIRMSTEADLGGFYKLLGDFLKRRCTGSEAYLYFGNRDMLKQIGLKPAWKKPLRHAGLDGRVAKFELY